MVRTPAFIWRQLDALSKREMLVRVEPALVDALEMRRSRPYAKFKSTAGDNNHLLITALVGLDAVQRGQVSKDPSFSTTWNPVDVKRSSERSRAYVLSTSLVWIADLVDEYRKSAQGLPGVCSPSESAEINAATKDGRQAGRSLKLVRFAALLGVGHPPELAIVRLAMNWRNRAVHSASDRSLDPDIKGDLRGAGATIEAEYNGLVVERMIDNEAKGKAPDFKEMAAVTRASHRLVEALDRGVRPRLNLVALANDLIRAHLGDGDQFLGRTLSTWPGAPEKTERKLTHLLVIGGFQHVAAPTDAKESADHRLAVLSTHIADLSRLSVHEARERFSALPLPEHGSATAGLRF